MKINNLNIDVSDMSPDRTIRSFKVNGDVGAEFEIIVLQADTLKYYDFNDRSFALGHNDIHNNLRVKLTSKNYSNNIVFPSGGGDYVIKLIVINETELINPNKKVITKNISKQATNITMTFQPGSISNSNTYATLPSSTSTGSTTSTAQINFNWDVINSNVDAYSYGLRPISDTFKEADWYFTTTNTVDGAISSSTSVVVDDVTDIGVGTTIIGVSGGDSLSGTPSITAVDTATKTLTLSIAQTFSDGITLTFKAAGVDVIKEAIGLNFTQTNPLVTPETLTTTVRADVSTDTVTLGKTGGISGGLVAKYTGVGVNNSVSNLIKVVTPDPDGTGTDGAMTVEADQELERGAVLTIYGSHKTINFTGTININKFPSASRTIYLDLDNLITPGVSGA